MNSPLSSSWLSDLVEWVRKYAYEIVQAHMAGVLVSRSRLQVDPPCCSPHVVSKQCDTVLPQRFRPTRLP